MPEPEGDKPETVRVERVEKLAPRRPEGHKGDYGRLLIVGGSRGMIGAVALAANAAFRAGAGLVTFAAPETVQLTVAGLCPCATSIPLECDESGLLDDEAARQIESASGRFDVLAVGPGMGLGAGQKRILSWALSRQWPLVTDADGLNNLANLTGWPAVRKAPLVLTPHPGEFARLTGRGIAYIQADRENAARRAVAEWIGALGPDAPPLVCVLKGAGTVVTDGRRVYVNDTGNPGMASGGAGDVLTGVVAALIGQGMAPFDAACLGVKVHGLAGDVAAERLGQPSVMATDLLDDLPEAMRRVLEADA